MNTEKLKTMCGATRRLFQTASMKYAQCVKDHYEPLAFYVREEDLRLLGEVLDPWPGEPGPIRVLAFHDIPVVGVPAGTCACTLAGLIVRPENIDEVEKACFEAEANPPIVVLQEGDVRLEAKPQGELEADD